ncbi:DUF4352 domain-containing protein [Actinoplanes sp. NPDC051346]|uniref:DUF4352 domain-containing protein n=1 Tax=Actinoplanes sp. NPDC051346 TaxID=3155048 RepID=UPI0034283166
MEVDQGAGVMRCPYCRREVPLPAPQAAGTGWPFGTGGVGMPNITISTTGAFAQTPEAIRRQKKMVLAVAVGTILAMGAVLTFVYSFIFSTASTFADSSSGEAEKVEEVAVGATARVQSFEATVRGVDCTKQEITKPDDPATSWDDATTEKAKGKFCVVSFSVKNVGEKTEDYRTWNLEATSPTERVLERNRTAESYANKEKDALSEPIDPGKTVDQFLVFDVPTDTSLAYLQLLDDPFADSIVKVKFGS